MKNLNKIGFGLMCLLTSTWVSAQDTTINRNVTVEREFQPIIQDAGKVNQKPEVNEVDLTPAEIVYSDYNPEIDADYNMTSLLSQPLRVSEGKLPHGELTAGVGHTSTLLDFNYHIRDRYNDLKIYAEHEACWGKKVLETSEIGLDFKHEFSALELYFNVNGGNQFYSRYGHYYISGEHEMSVEHLRDMKGIHDLQTVWSGGGNIGFRSKKGADIRYDVNVGYQAFHMPDWATEHAINTKAKVEWSTGDHVVGGRIDLLDLIYTLRTELPEGKSNMPRHSLRMEPYYEYHGNRIFLHAGVNLELAINKGKLFSGSEYIAFAPSPNIRMETQIAPKWLTIYADARGSLSRGSMRDYVEYNRYMTVMPILYSQHVGRYAPINSMVGFYIKPHKNLLLDIHAGYAYHMNQKATYAVLDANGAVADGMLNYFYTSLHTIKVGGELRYHYRDIFEMKIWGDYYTGPQSAYMDEFDAKFTADYARPDASHVYDRAPYVVGARFDGHIDKNWSVYTTLLVEGRRWTMTNIGEKRLGEKADWNIGAQYDWVEKNLVFFAQVNNLICRYNELYYGYLSEGTNFLIGASWKF